MESKLWFRHDVSCVVKKVRDGQFDSPTDCMLKLVDLGNSHKLNRGVFEMLSDNGGKLKTLH